MKSNRNSSTNMDTNGNNEHLHTFVKIEKKMPTWLNPSALLCDYCKGRSKNVISSPLCHQKARMRGEGPWPQEKVPGRQRFLHELVIHLCRPHWTLSAVSWQLWFYRHCSFTAASHLSFHTFLFHPINHLFNLPFLTLLNYQPHSDTNTKRSVGPGSAVAKWGAAAQAGNSRLCFSSHNTVWVHQNSEFRMCPSLFLSLDHTPTVIKCLGFWICNTRKNKQQFIKVRYSAQTTSHKLKQVKT